MTGDPDYSEIVNTLNFLGQLEKQGAGNGTGTGTGTGAGAGTGAIPNN